MQYILEYRTVKGQNLEYRIFINHENLRVIRSFIGDNIQVVKYEGYHEFYLEWLEDDEKIREK